MNRVDSQFVALGVCFALRKFLPGSARGLDGASKTWQSWCVSSESSILTLAKKWNDKTVEGTVTKIEAEGVEMSIPCLPISATAQMHISQSSERYIENLATLFTVGQRITVKVRFLRKDQTAWQVSRKAALREAHWRTEFPDSHHATGCVIRIAPFGALVRLNDKLAGRISVHNLVLIPESQQLKIGSSVEVVFGKWDYEVQAPTLHPKIEVAATGLIDRVETTALIASAKKNHSGNLQVRAFVKTDAYGIVECDISRLVKIQERFPVGKPVVVSIALWIKILGGFSGSYRFVGIGNTSIYPDSRRGVCN